MRIKLQSKIHPVDTHGHTHRVWYPSSALSALVPPLGDNIITNLSGSRPLERGIEFGNLSRIFSRCYEWLSLNNANFLTLALGTRTDSSWLNLPVL